jgi:hypothetical protein
MFDPVLAAVSWLDVIKLGAALVAPLVLFARAIRKISQTMTAILEMTKRLPIVEHDVSVLKTDTAKKHAENTERLDMLDIKADAISSQVAGQLSTGQMIAEVLGEPLAKIAQVLTVGPHPLPPPPKEGT